MKTWKRTIDALPLEGVVVTTISAGGLEQDLQRQGPLWFFPDGSMYVYYQVEFWREREGQPC
jgi:hypothetical protein